MELAEGVALSEFIRDLDASAITSAAHRVVEAYNALAPDAQSPEGTRAILAIVQCGLAAMRVVDAVKEPARATHHRARAARAAELSVRESLISEHQAARDDYERLLQEYGSHEEVVIGEPLTCF